MQSLFGISLCQEMSHQPSRNVQSGNVGSPSTSFPPSPSLSYRIKIIMSWGFYLLNMSWFRPDFFLSYFAWISKVYYLLAPFQPVVYTVLRKSFQLLNWSCCSLPQTLCGIPINTSNFMSLPQFPRYFNLDNLSSFFSSHLASGFLHSNQTDLLVS